MSLLDIAVLFSRQKKQKIIGVFNVINVTYKNSPCINPCFIVLSHHSGDIYTLPRKKTVKAAPLVEMLLKIYWYLTTNA